MHLPDAHTWRRIAIALLWALVAVGGGWMVVRIFGLEEGFPLVPLIAYTPYVPVAALIVIVAAALLRHWPAATAALAVGVVLAGLVLPRAIPGQELDGAPRGLRLNVMTANLWFGRADPPALLELVREHDVDVLTVQELTPTARERLEAAGIDDLLPEQALAPSDQAAGTGIYSRLPLRESDFDIIGTGGFSMPRAYVTAPGAGRIELVSVHPPPPVGGDQVNQWKFDLNTLPRADLPGPMRVLAGDFNATLDHHELRELIESGYTDAADAVGAGLVPTWPSDGAPIDIDLDHFPLPVTIDHVLADERIWVEDTSVHDLEGSDHRAVLAELVLPSRLGPGRPERD